MNPAPRVRFAPSPTGPLHIGGVRTALFNYLFAKKHGGTFVLRIEDTDQNRFVPGAQEYIIEALDWCNIPYDEGPGREGNYGPYKQSERKHLYQQHAEQLIKSGWAYYAWDSSDSLNELRTAAEKEKQTFMYSSHNRDGLDNSLNLSEDEIAMRLASGDKYVVRFKIPAGRTLSLHDEIRGTVSIQTDTLDDKILFKSDGMPTYHLANIVDDHLMEITHVIRGEEWLPSMPLHSLLYEAFGWNAPKFAHLPLILKPNGKGKLSKRDGAAGGFPVFPLQYTDEKKNETSTGYREEGYLPEAVVNMLAFLGWNPGTEQEIFSLDELVQAFDLSQVNNSGSKFDPDKAKWFQQQYFVHQDDEQLARDYQAYLQEHHNIESSLIYTARVVDLVKERAVFLQDLWPLSSYFYAAPAGYNEKDVKKCTRPTTVAMLEDLREHLQTDLDVWEIGALHSTIKGWIQENDLKMGDVMRPLRLALVGQLSGPDVFDILAHLGKEVSLQRIATLDAYLRG